MAVACFLLPQMGIACERARLPHLWGRPCALAGPDGRLRVVSDEGGARGVTPGQSGSAARSLCQDLFVLPYDAVSYEAAARCLWDLFAVESSVVEPVSPETCFVEMTGADVVERTERLAVAVAATVRVTVMTGLASSKLVARQAALQDRDGRVLVVQPGQEAAFLAPLPLEEAPGLDAPLRQRLERLGVRRFGDLVRLPPRLLERRFGQAGLRLRRLGAGEDGDPVRPLWPPPCLEERVAFDEFDEEASDEATLREALRRCAEGIARRLGERREFCRSLSLDVGLRDGTFRRQAERLDAPLADAGALHRAALRLLRRLAPDQPMAEVTLTASDLGAGSGVQLSLLDERGAGRDLPHERQRRLDAMLAFLRRRFPASAPMPAGVLQQARRVGLWTYPLGARLGQPVEVATDRDGDPVRYWGRRHGQPCAGTVRQVQTRWKETDWFWGSVSERSVWRVQTEPAGLCELEEQGAQWRVSELAD